MTSANIIMDHYKWSSLRRLNESRETAKNIACTGDRYHCCCRACRFYRHEHWGLRPLSSSDESSSENEEEGSAFSRQYQSRYAQSSSSRKLESVKRYPQWDYTRSSTVFTRDDSSSEDEKGGAGHVSFRRHHKGFMSSWRSGPGYEDSYKQYDNQDLLTQDGPKRRYYQSADSACLSSDVHRWEDEKNRPFPLLESQNGHCHTGTYDSIQAQCDRILHLLDPCQSRKGISPGRNMEKGKVTLCQGKDLAELCDRAQHGSKANGLGEPFTECAIDGLAEKMGDDHVGEENVYESQCTLTGNEEVESGSVLSENELNEAHCDVMDDTSDGELCEGCCYTDGESSAEVNCFLHEDVRDNENKECHMVDEDAETNDENLSVSVEIYDWIDMMSEKDEMDHEDIRLMELSGKECWREEDDGATDEYFWWDNEVCEEETEWIKNRQVKNESQFKEDIGCRQRQQNVLLREWYQIEETLGLGESISTSSGREDTGAIYAEWCIIEEALNAETCLSSKSDEDACIGISESLNRDIQRIITNARLAIHEIVTMAHKDIHDIQRGRISQPVAVEFGDIHHEPSKMLGNPSNDMFSDQRSLEQENNHSSCKVHEGSNGEERSSCAEIEAAKSKLAQAYNQEVMYGSLRSHGQAHITECDSREGGLFVTNGTTNDDHQKEGHKLMTLRRQLPPDSDVLPGWLLGR